MSAIIKTTLAEDAETCPATGYQKIQVCVPVTIKPFANPGNTKTTCCGDPVVTAGINTCEGVMDGECSFTISQQLCIEVPVDFGATSTVGDAAVACGEVSNHNICNDCI